MRMSAHFWNSSKSVTKVLNAAPCFFRVCFMSCSRAIGATAAQTPRAEEVIRVISAKPASRA
jgi:hypothetical protein